jgi:hypothetical protein
MVARDCWLCNTFSSPLLPLPLVCDPGFKSASQELGVGMTLPFGSLGYVPSNTQSAWKKLTLAKAFLLIADILMNLEVNSGVGQHIEYLPDPESGALQIRKWNNFYQMALCVCTFVTKISISLYILRIKDDRILKWTLAVMMTFMGLAALACIIVLAVICVPLERFWNPTVAGHCIPLDTVYDVAYVQSAFTILTDLALTISPIVILWNVKVDTVKKVLVCVLMSLGLVATLANALRNYYQQGLIVEDYSCMWKQNVIGLIT